MGALPSWAHELVGSAFFTMFSSQAFVSTGGGFMGYLAVGLSFALFHSIFKSHCVALFNPVLSIVGCISGAHDFAKTAQNILAQYVGCFFGATLLLALGKADDLSPNLTDYSTFAGLDDGHYDVILRECFGTFLFVFAFMVGFSGKNTGLSPAMYWALSFAVVFSFMNQNLNPAQYTGSKLLNNSFFGNENARDSIIMNLVPAAMAVISTLIYQWNDKRD